VDFGPKTRTIAKIANFSPAGANPLPDVSEIGKVYAGNWSTEVVNIWCDSVGKLEIYRQKPRWGIFPQNFRSPLAPKLLVRLKKSRGYKNDTDILHFMQSSVEIRRCTVA